MANWYWNVKQRRGGKRAIIGLARKLLSTIYVMLRDDVEYDDNRSQELQMKYSEKREKKLIEELRKRGYQIEPQIA